MTHEQRAKKMLLRWLLEIRGYSGSITEREVDKFFHHLKQAMRQPND